MESEAATLAQAETKEDAIEAARDAAPELGAECIVVHSGDGTIEKEIVLQQTAATIGPPRE